MTAVSIGPIVTNSVTKLDRRLEGTFIGNLKWIVVPPKIFFGLRRLSLHRRCNDGGRLLIYLRRIRPRYKIELACQQHDRSDRHSKHSKHQIVRVIHRIRKFSSG
jgi:hypothetical protein